ncbi:DUF4235 domain-containing protein [Nonomuraea typhae]|uniref:DUF4235 domain-containing protein n=1 Tax=Nonomuraea typhae TaxID=2603600 RepID=UPI0012F81D25|nr:DUF4235 domain-containing protein [Nonomuraea typhae]
MKQVIAKPARMAGGVLGGLIAGTVFKHVWKLASGKDEPPEADSTRYGWGEVLVAAALQGAIFGVVKAAIERAAAGED